MAQNIDELVVFDGQLRVSGPGKIPTVLSIPGSDPPGFKHCAYIEGATQFGNVNDFTIASPQKGTVMIGGNTKVKSLNALAVKGNIHQTGKLLTTTGAVTAALEVSAFGGVHRLSNKKNLPFDMPHPSKKGWRLRHVCIEGPEIAVYCRGRVKNEKVIRLPSYWKDLVNIDSLSVQLTPIGSHQNIIVKRWDEEFVYLQNQGGLPINCFYHIIAQRVDDDLVVEYEGETHEDYPGGNEGYTFNWESSHVEKLIKEATREKLKELGIDKSDSPASKNDF